MQTSRLIESLIVLAFLSAILAGLGTETASPTSPLLTATQRPLPPLTVTPSPAATLTPGFTPSPTVTLAPNQFGARVTFTAQDGRELVGYFYPSWKPNAPVIVLMHQRQSDQGDWQESDIIPWMQNWGAQDPLGQVYTYAGGRLAQMPKDLSFAVFTFDFRGHGESLPLLGRADSGQYASEFLLDAKAAYATARTMPGVDPKKVIGIGASIGADAVVDACDNSCAGAFSVSPGNWLKVDFGESAQALLERGRPVRCMYAVNDALSPQTCWSIQPGGLYKIFAYPGIKHGMTFFVPRKMEFDFGTNLLEFLQAASK
jgi:hypothetical protein